MGVAAHNHSCPNLLRETPSVGAQFGAVDCDVREQHLQERTGALADVDVDGVGELTDLPVNVTAHYRQRSETLKFRQNGQVADVAAVEQVIWRKASHHVCCVWVDGAVGVGYHDDTQWARCGHFQHNGLMTSTASASRDGHAAS